MSVRTSLVVAGGGLLALSLCFGMAVTGSAEEKDASEIPRLLDLVARAGSDAGALAFVEELAQARLAAYIQGLPSHRELSEHERSMQSLAHRHYHRTVWEARLIWAQTEVAANYCRQQLSDESVAAAGK